MERNAEGSHVKLAKWLTIAVIAVAALGVVAVVAVSLARQPDQLHKTVEVIGDTVRGD